jgi:hypothetical protein
MSYTKWLITAVFAARAITADAIAGEQSNLSDAAGIPGGQAHSGRSTPKDAGRAAAPLDRVVSAVDGAESSHGTDMAMWRPDPSGPQGPMQVTEAAAVDVGGGDRFDLLQNRTIGRAYLSQLFWHYGNWPDAIAAYNWGVGNMDAWVKAGRPPDKFLAVVAVYTRRVLHESGLCSEADGGRSRQPGESAKQPSPASSDTLVYAACSASDAWTGPAGFGGGPTRFSRKLDQALQLALQRAAQGR